MIYFTSDLHFNHTNIIKHSKRPFKDATEMNETLIKNWNEVIKKNDTVIIAGDFAYGDKKAWKSILIRLEGKKILVLGNHDKMKNIPKECFKEITSDYQFYFSDDGKDISFFHVSHYPMTSWNRAFKDGLHIYGHVHNNINTWEYPNLPNTFNVGVDVNDFRPISAKDIIKKKVNFVKTMKKKGLLVD